MYNVNEQNLEKLILLFKKVLNGVDQSGLGDFGMERLLHLTRDDLRKSHSAIDVIKDELKLFRAEG